MLKKAYDPQKHSKTSMDFYFSYLFGSILKTTQKTRTDVALGKATPPKGAHAPKGAPPPKAPGTRLYPAGKRLMAWEASKSVRLAPKDGAGKTICWDFSTHIGCQNPAASCPHSHRQITTTAGVAWEVVAQLLRRGGLKTSTPVPPGEVDARIDQLRKQSKAEKDASIKEGSGGTRGGELVDPPPEYTWFDPQQREAELQAYCQGPDASWLDNVHVAQ